MSIFNGIFQNIQTTDSGVEFSFEDIRFNLTNSKLELDYEVSAMENYFAAFDRLTEVCVSIESYDGKLDDAVRNFIDCNGEISAALGIALEDDQNTNGQEVKEKSEKGFFAKAWDAIKKFFTSIWNKIVGFFKWIGNGFKKLPEKVDAAEKAYNELTPEEKQKFLETAKVSASPRDIEERFKGLIDIIDILKSTSTGKITDVMDRYYTDPRQFFSPKLRSALEKYNIVIVSESGKHPEEYLNRADPSFVNQVFSSRVTVSGKKAEKSFKEMGWTDEAIQKLFMLSDNAAKSAKAIEKVVNTLESEARSMNAAEMEEQYRALLSKKDNWLSKLHIVRGPTNRLKESNGESYRKGLNTICNLYRACLWGIKDVWVDSNKILEAVKKSPAQIKAEAEAK